METEPVDLLVVGCGIHGAGIAQAAAAAGHSVLVLERAGIAAGTSSRSSKLIHGGLRYLESGQLALVRECLRERATLLRLAPGLVRRVAFHIPVYRDTRRRPWLLRAGLSLYALLAGPGHDASFRSLPRARWDDLDGLERDGLQAVFRYWDAQTDDAALTRAVMASAARLGARLELPAEFTGAELEADGCRVEYRIGEQRRSCAARVLVNAAGPWVNRVLDRVRPRPTPLAMDLVQGTHVVVEGALEHGVYYLEAPQDARAVFAMPWPDGILVGTTETPYAGDPGAVHPLPTEEAYLLETLARYFPRYRDADTARVRRAFAGLRVLPSGAGSAFARPRETRLHPDRAHLPRVVSIYGGKLTAHRATARRLLAYLAPVLPQRAARADVDRIALSDQ